VEFAALTFACEEAGLFEEPSTIGTREGWRRALEAAGCRVEGHRLVRRDGGEAPVIRRHRTAIRRPYLSTPVQALLRHGYLDGSRAVFDYGCGRGDDLQYLIAMGVEASGWDPHFAPEEERREAEIVNLGFVVNVIEQEAERRAVVRNAYALAKELLVVSAMLEGRQTGFDRRHADGVVTSRETFQKYFTQDSLREFLNQTLGQRAIAVGPGIFFAFRDKGAEQRFLLDRQSRRGRSEFPRERLRLPRRERTGPARGRRVSSNIAERDALLEPLWERCLTVGREPHPSELPPGTAEGLAEWFGSVKNALRFLVDQHGVEALEAARDRRIEDLTVYLALNLFERRRKFSDLPEELRLDLRAFFGSFQRAEAAAKDLLFSVGKPEVVAEACQKAAESGFGYLEGGHSLQLLAASVEQLPAVLRCYVGCAAVLYGDVENSDLVKIHIRSGKLTLHRYDDFWGKPLPRLQERIKIKMREQDIEFFEYGGEFPEQYLYLKSRYLTPEAEGYERQVDFDRALEALGAFDFSGFGPPAREFDSILEILGVEIMDFTLVAEGERRADSPLENEALP
jgi:DNA phosphorothioation-associated putative methyltransferase